MKNFIGRKFIRKFVAQEKTREYLICQAQGFRTVVMQLYLCGVQSHLIPGSSHTYYLHPFHSFITYYSYYYKKPEKIKRSLYTFIRFLVFE